ncbi:hypothetical protein J2T19_000165 [Paenibacillus tundrae]|uniref:Uncharacterized protein n=1 Tax=Paenibacillus tundrae TaxID=528187 RepID=A0ABT9W652_9BACL|nr:hypothetical protein [Paenibacillus tundrae]
MSSELSARLAAHQRQEIAALERSVMVYRGLADKYERRLYDAKQRIYETEMNAHNDTANSNEA